VLIRIDEDEYYAPMMHVSECQRHSVEYAFWILYNSGIFKLDYPLSSLFDLDEPSIQLRKNAKRYDVRCFMNDMLRYSTTCTLHTSPQEAHAISYPVETIYSYIQPCLRVWAHTQTFVMCGRYMVIKNEFLVIVPEVIMRAVVRIDPTIFQLCYHAPTNAHLKAAIKTFRLPYAENIKLYRTFRYTTHHEIENEAHEAHRMALNTLFRKRLCRDTEDYLRSFLM
jgi:hypothetical protein